MSARTAIGHRVVELEVCESTNDEAAALAQDGCAHGVAVLAARQTGGRGRRGRIWDSPAGHVYTSIVVRPQIAVERVPALALVAGLAVVRAAKGFGAAAAVKWPNDVLVGDRKLAGVLCEVASTTDVAVVVGIGINVRGGDRAADIADIAIALDECADPPASLRAVADAVYTELDPLVATFCADGDLRALRSAVAGACSTIGRRVRTDRGHGRAVDIGEDGALVVEIAPGRHVHVVSGEVAVVSEPDVS